VGKKLTDQLTQGKRLEKKCAKVVRTEVQIIYSGKWKLIVDGVLGEVKEFEQQAFQKERIPNEQV